MKKSIFSTILVSILLFFLPLSAFAYPDTEAEFFEYLDNMNIPKESDTGQLANWSVYKSYNLIVYGNPHGRFKQGSQCAGHTSEYEHLGYKADGKTSVTNTCFPNDADSGKHPREWNYIKVEGARASWDSLDTFQIQYLMTMPLSGNGALASDNPPFTVLSIGGQEYCKVMVAPTWKNSGSIFTQNTGTR